jgi:hypothetical protein
MDAIISGNVIRKFIESDFYMQVKKRKINGSSVQNIKRVYEGENLNIHITMSKKFHETLNISHEFAPILYILTISRDLIEVEKTLNHNKKNILNIWGFLGRSYRSYASFIRDYDSIETIREISRNFSKKLNKEIKVEQNPEIDARGHTDIFVHFQNDPYEYRIWLYQSTPRGLKNLLIRLTGTSRGELLSGYHFLVPINVFKHDNKVQNLFNWALYSDSYLESVIEICAKICNNEIHTIISYQELIQKLQFDRNLYNNLDYWKKKDYLEKWSIEQREVNKKLFSSFFFFKKN